MPDAFTITRRALARFLPGIRSISISHYTQSAFVRLLDDRRVTIDGPSSTQTIIVVVVSLALATWRLRTMAIE